jgi:hypothetical protein
MTRRRIRSYAIVIAATLWTIWLVDMSVSGHVDRLGKVKGTDFLHFYVMGSIAREGRWEQLFDVREHQVRAQAIAPGSPDTVYIPVESPQLALLFAPLATAQYTVALALWLGIVFITYACSCALMWRDCPALRTHGSTVAASCAAFPGLYSDVLYGQSASLTLGFMAIAFYLLRRKRQFAAGVALGCLVFKPHWVLAAAVMFVAAREWRIVAGIALSAFGQVAMTFMIVGALPMRAYAGMLAAIPRIAKLLEPRPGDSLRGLFEAFSLPEPAALLAYGIASIVTLTIAVRVWRSDESIDIRLSAVTLAIILISPHVNAYDLMLIAPIALMVANRLVPVAMAGRGKALSMWLCVVLAAPLLYGLPAVVRLQCSATAMAVMLYLLWRNGSGSMNRAASARVAVGVQCLTTSA